MLVFSDLLDEVKHRYLNDGGGTMDASDTQVEYWLRQAAQFFLTTLPPIKLDSIYVQADNTALLPALTSRVYFVGRGASLLFNHQWLQYPNHIHLKGRTANAGDELSIWYHLRQDTSSASEIDTDCVFGDDWLKEIILVQAGMQLQRRDSKRAPGRGGTKEAQAFRVDQADRGELYQMMKAQWDGFFAEQRDRLQTRLAFGDTPIRDSPLAGFTNDARILSPLDVPGRSVP